MPAVKRQPECPSDFALDQLLGQSADAGERARAEAHLAVCVRCTVRYEALHNQRAGYLARLPSWQQLHAQQSAAKRARFTRRGLWSAGALAAAASVGLVFALAPGLASGPSDPGVRLKGGPTIGAWVKHGAHVTRVQSGDAVAPGDALRFTYTSEQPVHFALLNRDASRASAYFPLGAQTEQVAAGREVALDFSIALDAQPGSEQIHGVFCDRPVPLRPLLEALQTSGRLPPLPHCRVDVLTLEKTEKTIE